MTELTPGQLLVASREHRGLSQSDVAKFIRLSLQTVKDLEKDEYTHIGVRTFVRGYLCTYARLVHLPESRVLEAFDALTIPAFDEQIVPVKSAVKSIISDDASLKKLNFSVLTKHRKLIGLTAVAIVVVALGVDLFGSQKTSQLDEQKVAANNTSKPAVMASSKSSVSAKTTPKVAMQSFELVDTSKAS